VYLRAVKGAFTEGTNLNAWIFTIAANSARDHFRRKNRNPDSLQDQVNDLSVDSYSALEAIIQNEEASAMRRRLRRCLELLSESEFAVVDARVHGKTHIEIAAQQSWVSPNRSEKTFFRAKQKLKVCIESGESS
jgi:RNA polymerase sigma factor (sigma-70 family)